MLRSESYKKGLLFSTVLNIIARGVGFINTLILAYFFGANASTDIYFLVLSVALIITGVINGIDFLILIPEAMKLRERESEEASQKFINFFLYSYAVIGLFIAAVVVTSPVLFFSIFSKFDPSLLQQNSRILYIGSIIIVFQLLNSLLGAILSSYKFFTASILTALINSAFAIIITVFFHQQLGIVGTISGIALGYVINFILLVCLLKRFQKWNFSRVAWMKSKTVWVNIGLVQVNNLPIWLRNYATLFLLSGLGSGIITSVTVAQQITAIIDVILITQVMSVVGIKLSECNSKKDFEKAAEIFNTVSKGLLLIVLPIVVVVVFYAHEIRNFLFTKESFTETAASNIELALKYLIILTPYNILNNLCTRLFASFQVIGKTVVPSILSHIVFLTLAIVLITNFGLLGYLYSQIAGFTVLMFLFYLIMKKVFPFIKFNAVILFAIKQALLNVAVAVCLFQLNRNVLFLNGFTLLLSMFIIQCLFSLIINYRNPYIAYFFKRIYAYTNKSPR